MQMHQRETEGGLGLGQKDTEQRKGTVHKLQEK